MKAENLPKENPGCDKAALGMLACLAALVWWVLR